MSFLHFQKQHTSLFKAIKDKVLYTFHIKLAQVYWIRKSYRQTGSVANVQNHVNTCQIIFLLIRFYRVISNQQIRMFIEAVGSLSKPHRCTMNRYRLLDTSLRPNVERMEIHLIRRVNSCLMFGYDTKDVLLYS